MKFLQSLCLSAFFLVIPRLSPAQKPIGIEVVQADQGVSPDFAYQAIMKIGFPDWDESTTIIGTDFNGDNIEDFLVYRRKDGTFQKWYGDKNITASFISFPKGVVALPDWDESTMLIPMDFNGDGKIDILVYRPKDGTFAKWYSGGLMDGGFVYQEIGKVGLPNWDGSTRLIPIDFNGDGKMDILVYRPKDGVFAKWYSDGSVSAGFNFQVAGIVGLKDWDENTQLIPMDFNGDGKMDILVYRPKDGVFAKWYSDGGISAGFDFQVAGKIGFKNWDKSTRMIPVDFNADGKMDLLVYNPHDGAFAKWYSNDVIGPDFLFQTEGKVGLKDWDNSTVLIPADFNGDGKPDILVYNPHDGAFAKWYGDGNIRPDFDYQAVRQVGLKNWDRSTQLIPIDFNGDHEMDILVYRPKDGVFAKWYSDGSAGPDFNYQVAGKVGLMDWDASTVLIPADFNRDGKTDVLVYRPKDGVYAKWYEAGDFTGIEVSQAIQNMSHTVPLCAGKRTWARVYLKDLSPAPIAVRGTLTATNLSTGQTAAIPSLSAVTVDPAKNGQMRVKRESLSLSLNFQLPADFTVEGAFQYALTNITDANTGLTIGCSNCDNSRTVSYKQTPPIRIRMVGLQYTTGKGAATTMNTPRQDDFNLLKSWLIRAYPSGQVLVSQVTVNATSDWMFSCDDANGQLSSMRNDEIDNISVDPRTHYIGLVFNSGGFMRGCSYVPSHASSSPTGPTSGGNVPVNVTGDNDASFGDWYAGHELGHSFGRNHPGFCPENSHDDDHFPYPNGQISTDDGDFTGLDVGDFANGVPARALPGASTFDIMTYCNQPQWPSYYTYAGILDQSGSEDPSASGAPAAGEQKSQAQIRDSDLINIVASVNLSQRTAKIQFVNRLRHAQVPESTESRRATIRLLDKEKKLLGEYPVLVRVSTDRRPGQDSTALIDAILPYKKGIASLEITLLGKVAAVRAVSPHAPVVQAIQYVDAKKKFPRMDGLYISWKAEDADKDSLSYIVQARKEKGIWETVAVGLRTPGLVLTRQQIGQGQWTELRVIASDGFNKSEPVEYRIGVK
ncbi:MAG TPA: VCBS repeat-containing protein [Puia sp.]|nr:VCBS repeat-containing protein [Puia sp.]